MSKNNKTNSNKSITKEKKTKAPETYLQIAENNDHEGETWNYFLKNSDPKTQTVLQMVEKMKENEVESFEVVNKSVSEAEVKVLMKINSRENTTYKNEYNLVKGINEENDLSGVLAQSASDIEEQLYKGKMFNCR